MIFLTSLQHEQLSFVMSINRQSAQNLVVRAVEKLRKSLPILKL